LIISLSILRILTKAVKKTLLCSETFFLSIFVFFMR
jgi:hypothetical protein